MTDEMLEKRAGVVCLHCGKHVPLSNPMNQGPIAGAFSDTNRHVSIVRCFGCGKEAPYLGRDVILLAGISGTISAHV